MTVYNLSYCKAQRDSFLAFVGPDGKGVKNSTVCMAFGRSTGKSWLLRLFAYMLIKSWDGRKIDPERSKSNGVRIVIVMPTLVQFKSVHGKLMVDELISNEPWNQLGATINRSEWKVSFPGGSWIQVISAEQATRAAGIRCDAVLIDEADDVPMSFYQSVIAPWLTEAWSLNMQLIVGTPRRGRYGLLWAAYNDWVNGTTDLPPIPGAQSFFATYEDLPESILNMNKIRADKIKLTPDTFAREYLCDFDAGEGLVYPQFHHSFHVTPPKDWSIFHTFVVGIDHGVRDPTAILVIGIAGYGEDRIYHVLREEYGSGWDSPKLIGVARSIEGAYPGAHWYADHDAFKNDLLHKEAKLHIETADKSFEPGVSCIQSLLSVRMNPISKGWYSQLYIDPSCKHTIAEFGKYSHKRDPKDPDRMVDSINRDKDDHCMDALRYGIFSLMGPVKRIERGQKLH